ncbi:MAG: ATP-binding protein [Deltaproteobacteria bacterium]|nr:ATP-binding protein [Deltaproteobacteria bacterium]
MPILFKWPKINKSFTLGMIVLITLYIISWQALVSIENHIRENLNTILNTTLDTSHKTIKSWAMEKLYDVKQFASRPDLIDQTRLLLEIRHQKKSILGSKPLKEIRRILKPMIEDHKDLGFFIIAPDYYNIASMRDSNLNTLNLTSKQGGYLEKAFSGKLQFVLPILSDVPLPNIAGKIVEGEATMFSIAPIYDKKGKIIAALAIRTDPSKEFTRFTQLSRGLRTGDIYVFDKKGRLMTEPRFEYQLREGGLLKKDQRGILNLSVRDPGGDITKGFKPRVPHNRLPLTEMAISATAGNRGLSIDGYNDYRGVKVVGAWLWDKEYGFGLAYEIDLDEAYQNYYFNQRVILIALSISLFVFIAIQMLLIIYNRKAKAELRFQVLERTRELYQSKAFLQSALDNSPAGIIIAEAPKGNIVYINQAVSDFRGQESPPEPATHIEEELQKKRLFDQEGIEIKFSEVPLNRALHLGEVVKGEEIFVREQNGKESWAVMYASPIYGEDGQIIAGIVVFIDITRQKISEREAHNAKKTAELANQAKSLFLANMSHEFRTPLNTVIGYSEVLDRMIHDPSQKEHLCRIMKSGRALMNLINNVLDLSKIESGKFELKNRPVILGHLFEEIRHSFQNDFTKKNLQFDFEISPDLSGAFLIDETHLNQIITNLLTNALKFTKVGYVSLKSWSASPKDNSKGGVDFFIEVSDTGIGIAEEHQSIIFEAFEQVEGISVNYSGTGLGLNITKKLVEMMGGEISLVSEENKGTTLTVRFKNLEPCESSHIILEETDFDYLSIIFKPARVLIADDLDDNRELIVRYLENYDFDLILASNGIDVLDKIRLKKPDIFLLDLKMPKMNGYELIQTLRRNSEFQSVPIIVITASALKQEEDQVRLICDEYIKKPLESKTLIQHMMKYLPYEKRETAAKKIKPDKNLSKDEISKQLSDLPKEYTFLLSQAIKTGRVESIEKLARVLPKQNSSLAKVISELIQNYEMETLRDIIR